MHQPYTYMVKKNPCSLFFNKRNETLEKVDVSLYTHAPESMLADGFGRSITAFQD